MANRDAEDFEFVIENSADEIWTVEDLAAFLKVKPSWVYEHTSEIPHIRVGRYLRFERSAVLEWLHRRRKRYFGLTRSG